MKEVRVSLSRSEEKTKKNLEKYKGNLYVPEAKYQEILCKISKKEK